MSQTKLDHWSLVVDRGGPLLYGVDAEAGHTDLRLHGKVTDHTRLPDGAVVTTSLIVGRRSECVETKSGSLYELGQCDPEHEAAYPNQRTRLLAALPIIS